jgi:GT2 family glycosyltransferase
VGAKRLEVSVEKSDVELGIVWGFVSVADIVDLQGDIISSAELRRMVYQFMEDYYAGAAAIKLNHDQVVKTVLVESAITKHGENDAWWVGVKLLDEDLRTMAREGQISGFSIGGYADVEEE